MHRDDMIPVLIDLYLRLYGEFPRGFSWEDMETEEIEELYLEIKKLAH